MKLKYSIAALAVTTMAANAAITASKDVTAFTDHNLGSGITDGTIYSGGWTGVDSTPSLSGSALVMATPVNNGWVQQSGGGTAWTDGTAGGDSWTVEVSVAVNDGDTLSLWGANGFERFILSVGSESTMLFDGTEIDAAVNDDSAHVFRIAYDSVDDDYAVWRDGVELGTSFAQQATTTSNRLIVGDCCSSQTLDTVTIDYISFDTGGAFAPVPEPSSAALLGLGGLALILRRRK